MTRVHVRGGYGVPISIVACFLAVTGLTGCTTGDGRAEAGAGGTLRIAGSSDVEHLDTASANSVGAYALNRVYARTLLGTRSSNDFAETVAVRADVATRVPSRANGGISADGRTYTFRLRDDVQWNTRPPRPVTAADFVRGLKRLCNPAAPSGGQTYFTATIRGMAKYCRGFAAIDAPASGGTRSAAAIAAYQNEHDVRGLRAENATTLVIELTRPASDFLNIMALPFTAAAPVEYDQYVPDSPEFRQNTISNGPYQIRSYNPGRSYLLEHNPAWLPETDPLRGRYVAQIEIMLGQDSAESVQRQLEQGTADLAWDQPVPTSALARLRGSADKPGDPRLSIRTAPSSSPYLVFNTLSPHNKGALGEVEVRQAMQYAVDRSALIKIYGGPAIAKPLHTVIPPGNTGHAEYNLYPTPNDAGDAAECRRRLAAAGHPNGLRLRMPYRTNGHHELIAQSIQAGFTACGIEVELIPDTNGTFYAETLTSPARTKAGEWDIAAPGWTPDWYGNNGRTVVQPLFDGRAYGRNSTNYGGYHNPRVNQLIDAALTADDADAAAGHWQQADQQIMRDAAIIPLMTRGHAMYHSSRVRNAYFLPTSMTYDYTRIRLRTG